MREKATREDYKLQAIKTRRLGK